MPNGDLAREFFRQLGEFSARYIAANVKSALPASSWGDPKMATVQGAVIHYTADEDLNRVIRWFNDPSLGAKASSHVIVADRQLGSQGILTQDLPLVADLPATVIQCRPPDQQAWHGTWTNTHYFGVECISAGELRTVDGRMFTSWRPKARDAADWTAPWSSVYKTPIQAWGRWWDPFTVAQVDAVVRVLRYLRDLPGVELKRPCVVGHEHVQSVNTLRYDGQKMRTDKRDPGPTCPIHGIREAVFDDWRPLEQSAWFNRFRNAPVSVALDRDDMVRKVVRLVSGMGELPSPEVAWDRFRSAAHVLPVKDEPFGAWGKLALWLLGYYMPSVERAALPERLAAQLDSDEWQSVWLFQKMAGLVTDGKPGVNTRWALLERLKDRGIL